VGENLHTCAAFRDFIVSGAVDFIQPDVARAGGVSEILKIASLAARHGTPISFHTWGDAVALAASVHLSAAIRGCSLMELDYTYNPLRNDLLREPLELSGGYLIPPPKPGLGVEIDPAAIRRFSFSGAEELAVRRETLT
jgi:L-alanine-DL-glutamate epimerase-like enolase superfamily enzyme